MAFVEKNRFDHQFRRHTKFRCRLYPEYFDTSMARMKDKMVCPRYGCWQCGTRGPRNGCESHEADCNLNELLKNRSEPSNQKRSVNDLQEAVSTLQEYLKANKVKISQRAEMFQPLWKARSSCLFFFDTEFAGDLLVEICVMKIGGEVVIDTIVDYETKILICYDEAIHDIERGTIDKIYETEREKYISGMTKEELAEALITKGFGPNSTLVEWSMARCDYLKLRKVFENLGLGHLMPPVNNSWLVLRDWIDVVKKSKADLDRRLSLLYIVLGLDDKSLQTRRCCSRWQSVASSGLQT